jgi:hypothetical protein
MTEPVADNPDAEIKVLKSRTRALGAKLLAALKYIAIGIWTGLVSAGEAIASDVAAFGKGLKTVSSYVVLASLMGGSAFGTWSLTALPKNGKIAELREAAAASMANEREARAHVLELQQQLTSASATIKAQQDSMSAQEQKDAEARLASQRAAAKAKRTLKKQPESKGFWQGITGSLP